MGESIAVDEKARKSRAFTAEARSATEIIAIADSNVHRELRSSGQS